MKLITQLYQGLATFSVLTLLTVANCAGPPAPEAPKPVVTSSATPIPLKTEPLLATFTATAPGAPASTTPSARSSATSAISTLTPVLVTPTSSPSIGQVDTQLDFLELSGTSCDIEQVIIISIDGLRPDALEQADTPTLDTLRAMGAYTWLAQAVLPSVTLVNHASMLGGMSPEKHGIYWNSNNPALGKVTGPTLFSLAHATGLKTAMIVGKAKLEHLVLPDSVDQYYYAGFTDTQVIDKALTVLQTDLPNIFFIHLPDVDSAGHSVGWMSANQLIAINKTDRLIGIVVATLKEGDYLNHTLLIITADHGGSGKSHGSASPEDMTIPWLAVGPGVSAGLPISRTIVTYDTAATALYALNIALPEMWDGQPVLEIFDQSAC